ncbi:MAG: LytTR family DNA-binding domain-containing protein [Eubacteriales bacterium]|nr:LytTR family DNA-binding domain-containing protein [Eubacteriales bacterium]
MNIAIVDDEQTDRAGLLSLLQEALEPTGLVFQVSEYESAEEFLSVFEPELFDLCFLDIYMNGQNGMEAGRRLRELDPELAIVFLTSSDEFVYEGYEVRALRYLRKPPTRESVMAVVRECARSLVLERRRLTVTVGKKTREIPYGRIRYILSVGNHIELHFQDGSLNLSARHTFSQTVEPLLRDFRFLSCARGVVVNLFHVRELREDSFLMDNGELLPISRRLYGAVRDAFIDFQFEHMI